MTDKQSPEPGDLLVACPTMEDPNFRRTVVLLCHHSPKDGSFGLVLNRRLELKIADLPQKWPSQDFLSLGGPVQLETLHILHLHGDDVVDSIPIADALSSGGDVESIRILLESGTATQQSMRFFLGYAGWGPGQLEGELDREDWFLARGQTRLAFEQSHADLWREALVRMGGEYALLVNHPGDARVN